MRSRWVRAFARVLTGRSRPGTWVPGSAHGRPYLVYVPPALGRRTRVPLVVLLHGCTQTAAEFAAATGFDRLADRHGFVALYPQQEARNHRRRCWRWYEAAHQRRGAGEPAIIAGITATVLAEAERWRIDPGRVYVAGLSAGGGMALILAATYPDVYAAVGVHSAPAYRSAVDGSGALAAMAGRSRVPPPRAGAPGMSPAIVFQGNDDTTVRPGNGLLIAEQWLAYAAKTDGDAPIIRTTSGNSDGRPYVISTWHTARGHKMLEYWRVDGLGHAWSGGTAGGSFSDPHGPSASTAMWKFFAGR